jgi:hypothetical protein
MVSKDAYYPFGMRITGLSQTVDDPDPRYKYNGKELDEEKGLELAGLRGQVLTILENWPLARGGSGGGTVLEFLRILFESASAICR